MEPLQFQVIDILSDDINVDENDKKQKEFVITFYGKTVEGKNVVCNISGYKPYFYMRVPGGGSVLSWTKTFLKEVKKLNSSLHSNPSKLWDGEYVTMENKDSFNFYGYNYDYECKKVRKYHFVKIYFKSYGDMKKCSSAIQSYYNENILHIEDDKIISSITKEGISKLTKVEKRYKDWFLQEHNCNCVANLYESKIHPQLRFIHEKDIQSCGWVKVTPPNAACL